MTAAEFLRIAGLVFAAHPVVTVRLRDRDPLLGEGQFGWHLPWDRTPMSEDRSILPTELFAHLDGMFDPADAVADKFAYNPSADETDSALSRACVRFGRVKAGLPALPGMR